MDAIDLLDMQPPWFRRYWYVIANPAVALDAITHSQATFTGRDLAMFVHRHSDRKEQFDQAMSAVRGSSDLIALGKDGRGEDRFTSRQMIETEQRLQHASELMAERERNGVDQKGREGALVRAETRGLILSSEQRAAFEHVTDGRGLSVVVGYAGTGKSAMLGVAREVWEGAGYTVRGAALSGIAAEGLEHGSGIASRTIASLEHQWGQDRELLAARDVPVIDEAGILVMGRGSTDDAGWRPTGMERVASCRRQSTGVGSCCPPASASPWGRRTAKRSFFVQTTHSCLCGSAPITGAAHCECQCPILAIADDVAWRCLSESQDFHRHLT